MPFPINAFVALRPYLYHLTARANLPLLRAERRLLSASTLLRAANLEPHTRIKRDQMLPIAIGDRTAILRDQAPLHESNVALTDGWTFDDLLADLNRRVFFWPDGKGGPITSGRRHFARYATPDSSHESIILRLPLSSLLAANPANPPLFSRYNSGSPRRNNGQPIPRGPRTFLPAAAFPLTPGRVIEVTFLDAITLPADTTMTPLPLGLRETESLTGPWSPLFP